MISLKFVNLRSFLVRHCLMLLCLITSNALAIGQEGQVVTLTTTGTGTNQDRAVQQALRSAIESTFGTFVSSKTEILNDELARDEILSVSSGNIQEYELLAAIQLPSGEYSASVKATVSITKLKSFTESKGGTVEFRGGAFAMNIKLKKFNEEQEYKTIQNMRLVLDEILNRSFDYEIEATDPSLIDGTEDQWRIPLRVDVKVNGNFGNFVTYFAQTLRGLALTESDVADYKKANKPTFRVFLFTGEKENQTGKLFETIKSDSQKAFQLNLNDQPAFVMAYDHQSKNAAYRTIVEGQIKDWTDAEGDLLRAAIREIMHNALSERFEYVIADLRNIQSYIAIKNLIHDLAGVIQNFTVANGVDQRQLNDYVLGKDRLDRIVQKNSIKVNDWFRPVITVYNGDQARGARGFFPVSLHYAVNQVYPYKRSKLYEDKSYQMPPYIPAKETWLESRGSVEHPLISRKFLKYKEAYAANLTEFSKFSGPLDMVKSKNGYRSTLYPYNELPPLWQYSMDENFSFWPLLPALLSNNDYLSMLSVIIKEQIGGYASEKLVTQETRDRINEDRNEPVHLVLSFIQPHDGNGKVASFWFEDIRTLAEMESIDAYTVKRNSPN